MKIHPSSAAAAQSAERHCLPIAAQFRCRAEPAAAPARRGHTPRPGSPAEDPNEPGEDGFPVPPELPSGPPPPIHDPDPTHPDPVREPTSRPQPVMTRPDAADARAVPASQGDGARRPAAWATHRPRLRRCGDPPPHCLAHRIVLQEFVPPAAAGPAPGNKANKQEIPTGTRPLANRQSAAADSRPYLA
jgi:hypothetical protein